MRPVWTGYYRLGGAGFAAAAFDIGAQQSSEALNNFRMDGGEVGCFRGINGEVVELERRERSEIGAMGLEPTSSTEEVMRAVAGATPEQMLKLKQGKIILE